MLTLTVFFFPARCVCLTMSTSKWLFKWTKWWATMGIVGCSLFGSRYLRSALNVQFHAPPPQWTLVTCLVRLFTQQPLRGVSSTASSLSSSSSSLSLSSSSSFDLQFGIFEIHLPRIQRYEEREPGRMSAFALNDPQRPLWHNYLSCHPFSNPDLSGHCRTSTASARSKY